MTKQDTEKKENRNKIIIGLILVAIMILSTVGYAFFSGGNEGIVEKLNYNDIEFIRTGGYWEFQLQGVDFSTQYNPKDTENISSSIFMGPGNYAGKTLYFVGDAPSKREIEINFIGKLVTRSQEGCIEEQDDRCDEDHPIKNCSIDNIIIIEEAEEIKISQDQNCITIAAPYGEQARVADAFIFKILGVQ